MHDDRFDGLARRFGTAMGRRTFAGSGVLLALGVRPAAALAAPARDDEPAVMPRAADVEAALCNCLGFGSKNSALVIGRA